MDIPTIIFIICYYLVLLLYFYTETSGNMKLRAPNKILMATMFFVWAIFQFEMNYGLLTIQSFLLVALFLAYLGDIFLLFDFGRGGDFFLCSNVVFFTYELVTLYKEGINITKFYWVFIIFIILIGALVYLTKKFPNIIKLGKLRYPFLLYLGSITLHGMIGLAVIVYLPQTKYLLLGLGSILYMVSDYFLTVNKFVIPNKWILRANSCTYFIGMLLIALSIGF